MSLVRIFRNYLGVASVCALFVACAGDNSPKERGDSDEFSSRAQELWKEKFWDRTSTAANLTTASGVAGTVGYLNTGFSGVLLRRNRFLTVAGAVVG